jgi:hypothetical protein
LAKLITNSFRRTAFRLPKKPSIDQAVDNQESAGLITRKAKVLAWAIFLIFFIQNGTLGLFPARFYFVYRNVRLSDLIMYAVIVYSLFCIKEYSREFNSRSLVILKILLAYFVLVFIGSALAYNYNLVEFFFRLKFLWASFMIFPYLLLIKRNAFPYLIKIIFPVAVVSNILYILSSLTGNAYLPDVTIIKQTIPGGFKIYRVYGGTFFGEVFFLGYIYFWITKKFKPKQLLIVALFILPQILAFGRGAWIYFIFTISAMFIWNTFKKKNFKTVLKQIGLSVILIVTVFYILIKLVPSSEDITGALQSRIEQGQEDLKYKEGTYGTRVENTAALVDLWLNSNILVGIGMHPMWVIAPVTEQESIYYWGFADLRGPGILAAYGLIGFLLFSLTQVYFGYISFKILKLTNKSDIYIFIVLLVLCRIIYFTLSINLFILTIYGLSFDLSFYFAVIAYKYEHISS